MPVSHCAVRCAWIRAATHDAASLLQCPSPPQDMNRAPAQTGAASWYSTSASRHPVPPPHPPCLLPAEAAAATAVCRPQQRKRKPHKRQERQVAKRTKTQRLAADVGAADSGGGGANLGNAQPAQAGRLRLYLLSWVCTFPHIKYAHQCTISAGVCKQGRSVSSDRVNAPAHNASQSSTRSHYHGRASLFIIPIRSSNLPRLLHALAPSHPT